MNVVKQCRHVKCKGTMTKWPVQKQTHKTTQKQKQKTFLLLFVVVLWTFLHLSHDLYIDLVTSRSYEVHRKRNNHLKLRKGFRPKMTNDESQKR